MNTTKDFHLTGIEDERAVEFMIDHDKKHGEYSGAMVGTHFALRQLLLLLGFALDALVARN